MDRDIERQTERDREREKEREGGWRELPRDKLPWGSDRTGRNRLVLSVLAPVRTAHLVSHTQRQRLSPRHTANIHITYHQFTKSNAE